MYGALDTSTSGMVAQRTRMNVIAANLANLATTRNAEGEPIPFRRRVALMSPGATSARGAAGVRVSEIGEDPAPFRKVFDPSHPDAATVTDPRRDMVKGYVNYPNVDPTIETINSIEARRAYEANVAAAEVTKSMFAQAMRLIA